MNGHPSARMKTILRQCEAEVKIFNSRWFQASIYRSKWSNIAGQGSNIEKSSNKSIFQIFFLDLDTLQLLAYTSPWIRCNHDLLFFDDLCSIYLVFVTQITKFIV